MKRGIQGTLLRCATPTESFQAFIPRPLPPQPAIVWEEVSTLLEKANRAIGQLNGVAEIAVDPAVLTYMYVRKEALLSSQIEGTQSTLDDLLKYESEQTHGIPVADVSEVSSYVCALNRGIERIREGFPLCLRLIRELHQILLKNSRGRTKSPGEFRSSQNWVGGTRPGNARFVPAPPEHLIEALGSLELFMNAEDALPVLVKAALIHLQFETIHPFLDGNGRLGRLLVTFFLFVKGVLNTPCLYLSLFFKQNRSAYYAHLSAVRKEGDWEAWINFFLEGVIETANDARQNLLALRHLFAEDERKIQSLARASSSALNVLRAFQKKPMLSASELARATGLSKPTVIKSLAHLIALGIITPASEKKWGQIYAYTAYTSLLTSE